MLIENAERFGLAQLHHFGDGSGRRAKSYCILLTSAQAKELRQARCFGKNEYGFEVAEADWSCVGRVICWARRKAVCQR